MCMTRGKEVVKGWTWVTNTMGVTTIDVVDGVASIGGMHGHEAV